MVRLPVPLQKMLKTWPDAFESTSTTETSRPKGLSYFITQTLLHREFDIHCSGDRVFGNPKYRTYPSIDAIATHPGDISHMRYSSMT
jgi:hypothetical protein